MALKVREMPPDTRATFPFDGRLVTAEVNGLKIVGTHNFVLRSAQSLFGSTVSCVLDCRLTMLAEDAAHSDFAEKQKQLLSRVEPFLT